ncbi:hypothetical protein QO004_001207 [Rhizobium mesoamericanum]|uniref:hypothetical protein n=1 Tax=Rhizobium mesoamericanum TaxID=1079800 RepID=UPI00278132BC|nr:hypothetical protein [Rhizobium mesoamericanum]
MALLLALHRLNSVASRLIISDAAGGTVVDVGCMAGLVAFLKCHFLLRWGSLQPLAQRARSCPRRLVYCLCVILPSFASAPWQIYALVLINACGAADILSVLITYLQDLIADRPGLGSSLVSVNRFITNGNLRGRHCLYGLFGHRTACHRRRPRFGWPSAVP